MFSMITSAGLVDIILAKIKDNFRPFKQIKESFYCRQIIGAVDVGCTIFVHLFAAYFGITVSLVNYKKYHMTQVR